VIDFELGISTFAEPTAAPDGTRVTAQERIVLDERPKLSLCGPFPRLT
jgi:hypothetical protein